MVCFKSLARLLGFVCAFMFYRTSAEYDEKDDDVEALFVNDGKALIYDEKRLTRSVDTSLNEIDDGIDERSRGGRYLPPDIFRSKDQCDFAEIQRMQRECICHKPKKKCVRINNPHGHVLSTMPECVIVERCEGICPYSTSCSPKVMESISVSVMVLSLVPRTGSSTPLEVSSECKTISIERHVKCACACGISQKDCLPNQVFNSILCRCECPEPLKAEECRKHNKSWNSSSCECSCPSNITQTCSTGAFFHKTQCKCVPIEAEKSYRMARKRAKTPFKQNND